eukprot:TRINITY_DN11840_c0_g1_i1.p1 TRINITY_DN11840_c0_g1~~TRINITY_DN11840_c0_g1_i1.p1  ORF type:complete len:201 (+),score=38.09 TRINITY_DN11840_c0_g1_i1:33-605(+)
MAKMSLDSFTALPDEILEHIFSHCGIKEMGRLASSSKRFYFSICSEKFWKKLGLQYWQRITPVSYSLLMWAMDVLKTFRWIHIVKSLSNNRNDGYLYKLGEKSITIGKFQNRTFNSKAFRIYFHTQEIHSGEIIANGNGFGRCVWKHGIEYKGNFKLLKWDGMGEYLRSDGIRYYGSFKDGMKCGPGTMI